MEPVDRTNVAFGGLVEDLDQKIASTAPTHEYREPEIIPPRFHERIPSWLGFTLVTILGIAFAFAVVQPWKMRCDYGRDLCEITRLDIDAVRVTVPESDLIAALPNIDAIDPRDVLTVGDILAMERFDHLAIEELLTDGEIDRILDRDG